MKCATVARLRVLRLRHLRGNHASSDISRVFSGSAQAFHIHEEGVRHRWPLIRNRGGQRGIHTDQVMRWYQRLVCGGCSKKSPVEPRRSRIAPRRTAAKGPHPGRLRA